MPAVNPERTIMIRNLKVLGLAFVAMLAMNAVVASAASASEYTCGSYECKATGSNLAGGETFTTPGGTVKCNSHYVIETINTANGTGLTGPDDEVTVTPTYSNCTAFGFVNATVTMHGCDYVFHAGASTGGGVYDNTADIECPTEKPITIKAGTCLVDVPEQTGLTNVKTTNVAGGITVQPDVHSVTINVTEDGFGCPFTQKGHTTASFHGHVLVSATEGGSISVSGS
jgi:hypothetical protein